MREMTRKDVIVLGNEVNVARIKALVNCNFSDEEIARVMKISVRCLNKIMNKHNIKR